MEPCAESSCSLQSPKTPLAWTGPAAWAWCACPHTTPGAGKGFPCAPAAPGGTGGCRRKERRAAGLAAVPGREPVLGRLFQEGLESAACLVHRTVAEHHQVSFFPQAGLQGLFQGLGLNPVVAVHQQEPISYGGLDARVPGAAQALVFLVDDPDAPSLSDSLSHSPPLPSWSRRPPAAAQNPALSGPEWSPRIFVSTSPRCKPVRPRLLLAIETPCFPMYFTVQEIPA